MLALSITCVVLALALIYAIRQSAIDRKEWSLERGALLQRIQSPEVAVAEYAERPERKPVPVISPDDDGAYKQLAEQRRAAA